MNISDKYQNIDSFEIYNSMGILTRTISVSSAFMKINIVDLPHGVYYMRLKHSNQKAIKFLKF